MASVDAPTAEPQQDQFFVQLVCAVGGVILLFHPIIFIGNQAMLGVLGQWPPHDYYYLPIIAGLLFLVTAALRNYRPGLSGVFAIQALIATGVYAAMVSVRTVEPMARLFVPAQPTFRPPARELIPGPGSWILLLLLFVPLLAAGLLASRDSRKFEPLLATFLRSAAGACIIMLFCPPLWGDATSDGFGWAAILFLLFSVAYFFAVFHTRGARPLAIGTSLGYPLAVVPVMAVLIVFSRLGRGRPGEDRAMLLLIAGNAILWVLGAGAAIGIRPREGKRILAGFAMSFGLAVLALIL
jgi:hypothetical protein